MADLSSLPPSQPRPSRLEGSLAAPRSASSGLDRPARAQMIVALLLGLLLVAIPLYLRRRPHVADDPSINAAVPLSAEAAALAAGSASGAPIGAPAPGG